ncbi:5-formyltetrahydrofolate cyclo-ligase [Nocardioides sp.]|uniref:5-formyltetrahydrofolate cyclo-ligase n=1 Tax=Nocardioides sp. TaxID=35761 RepID=UPI003566DD95
MAPSQEPSSPDPAAAAKVALRDQLLTARHRLTLVEIGESARRIAAHLLAADEVRRAATVAAYVSVGTEPGTGELLDELTGAGARVLLPRLLSDDDLDWAVHRGSDHLVPARRGLLEPDGPSLGPDAIASADVVLLPGLAVSPQGWRLGRGGGSYDRALARVPIGTFTCVLLYDDELDREVPVQPHDRRVSAAVSPSGLRRWAPGPG